MRSRFLLTKKKFTIEGNIYADKSAIVLDYLLREAVQKEIFSLREVAKSSKVSIGRVQQVFEVLVLHGILQTTGIRTAKRFSVKNPEQLLKNWLQHYSIIKKCKIFSYSSGFQNKKELIEALKTSDYRLQTVLALHSAADIRGYKNTNLNTLELYIESPDIRKNLEQTLLLEPQEQGYEVLLIEPYYKGLLKLERAVQDGLRVSSPLLTFLDLYHFPLRGIEQAEYLAKKNPELKKIYKAES